MSSIITHRGWMLVAVLVACAPAPGPETSQDVPEATVTIDTSRTHNRFSSAIPPAVRVAPGTVLEMHTKEASDGQFTRASTASAVESVDFDPIHPLTGPVYVEGAEPGDVLVVRLHHIEVTGWGWTAIVPGFGFLAEDHPNAYLKIFDIGPDDSVAVFDERIRVPIAPFPGVLGVAPPTDSMLSTIPPRANGGNMDNRHIVAGTTVYLPVFVPGALFSIGDTHAAQGDGEVSGTAIEAPMRIVLELDLLEGGHSIAEPQYESDAFYAVTAFATTLDEAARKATRYMVEYLVEVHGLDPDDAYVLCSLAGDLKISEVVDVPHVLVSMHMPKSVLGIAE